MAIDIIKARAAYITERVHTSSFQAESADPAGFVGELLDTQENLIAEIERLRRGIDAVATALQSLGHAKPYSFGRELRTLLDGAAGYQSKGEGAPDAD